MKKKIIFLLMFASLLSACGRDDKTTSVTSDSTTNNSSTTSSEIEEESSEKQEISLLLDSSEITTDADGMAIIKGTTAPKAKVKVGLGFIGDSTTADKNGKFQLKHELSNDEPEELKINASLDESKKSKKVIIKPSQEFITKIETEESIAAEESRIAEESRQIAESIEIEESRQTAASIEAQESKEKEIGSDITILSENPTSKQEEILNKLAKQAFERQFPYKGSKLHTIVGKIQDWTQNGDSWFYKCEATIVNAYGAKEKTVIDITISPVGPDSGEVSFY